MHLWVRCLITLRSVLQIPVLILVGAPLDFLPPYNWRLHCSFLRAHWACLGSPKSAASEWTVALHRRLQSTFCFAWKEESPRHDSSGSHGRRKGPIAQDDTLPPVLFDNCCDEDSTDGRVSSCLVLMQSPILYNQLSLNLLLT